jgi:hypothetical protein
VSRVGRFYNEEVTIQGKKGTQVGANSSTGIYKGSRNTIIVVSITEYIPSSLGL